MSAWLFDLGNTRLKCAPLAPDGGIGAVRAIAHTEDGAWFDVLPRGEAAYVASVAGPALRSELLEALTRRFARISLARTERALDGLRIAYAEPRKLGVDRFLALLAVHAAQRAPALIVGVGTALTLDLLAADGRHLGGRIAPSPQLMREALHARAPHLPMVGGEYVEFADDTEPALASGCEGAAVALVERSLAQAQRLLGVRPRLLLHGGGSEVLLPHLDGAEVTPSLVLEGLAHWARLDGRGVPVRSP